ncbi:hypothetical protein [Streptomyces sp. NPDC059460]|uniref:hypothetical protein n=1 Tax=Streptomyces sp. NPDC059460 TaxID=3346840 RepID=UPI0036C588F3
MSLRAQRRRRVDRLAVLVQLGDPRLEGPLPLRRVLDRGQFLPVSEPYGTLQTHAAQLPARPRRRGHGARVDPPIMAIAPRPYAYVPTLPGSALTADVLREWAAGVMAAYKVPGIELVESFPMTATGKIRKADRRPASRTRSAP